MTDRYRYTQPTSTSGIADRVKSRQYSGYSSPTTTSRYYTPPPTYSPVGSSRDPRTRRPEISSYFTDNEVVSGNVRVPRRDIGPSSDIGDRIRNTVAERQGRGYGSYTPPGYEDVRNRVSGAPSHQSIFDSVRSRVNPDVMTGLGDMIRNRAQGGATSQLGGIPGIAPGQRPEPPNLSGLGSAFDMGQSIRDRVMGGIGGRQQPSIPNDPRISGAPQQSSDGSWGMNQGGYEDIAAAARDAAAPDQGQQPPPTEPTPPMDPGAPGSTGTGGGTPGQLGSYGNASIDQWDSAFIAAYEATGVDPHLLKAMAEIESGGNGNIPLNECRDDGSGIPSCGLMQVKPKIWGEVSSTEEQIMQAAEILADAVNSGQYATHRDALFGIYFPSDDPNGTTQGIYGAKVDELLGIMGPYVPGGNVGAPLPAGGEITGALPGTTQNAGGAITDGTATLMPPSSAGPSTPEMTDINNEAGLAIIDAARQYADIGIPYSWGATGEKGSDIFAGVDCSGLVRWLDQHENGGTGTIDAGSHIQYLQAEQNGILEYDPTLESLEVGDVVFVNTYFEGGGGAELNDASHVMIYAGDGYFIHSADAGVVTVPISYIADNGYQYLGHADMYGKHLAPAQHNLW